MHNLSVSVIAKDETPFLEEWVSFHRAVGVDHFYIYDNGSAIPIKDTLTKYIQKHIVTVINFPGRSMQMPSFNHCLQHFGAENKWIGYWDIDEFLVPMKEDNIQNVLKDFENYGGLNVNWRCFGSNGHIKRPEGLVIENYTMATPDDFVVNLHTKAIVQPKYTVSASGDPHHFRFKPGYNAVSEKMEIVPNAFSKSFSTQTIQLNHYVNRSLEDFKEKRARGRSDCADHPSRSFEDFHGLDSASTVEDKSAARFADKVKSLIL